MESKSNRPSVLAVDDYEPNLIALQAAIGDEYDVVCVASGPEAIRYLKGEHSISVILMDIQMPEIDGFEAATEIKRLPSAKEIPIIFITAVYKEEPFVKRGYDVGGIDYFSKPFDPQILKMKLAVYSSFHQRHEVLKSRERQIKETEELLRVGRKLSAVLEGLPVGVLISDVKGRVCQINGQVSRICHSERPANPDSYGEMLGWWDHEGSMLASNGPLSRALQKGESSHSEHITIHCSGGAKKSILCSASPLLGLDGHIVGAVIVLQDVTESKRIEEDLENRITRVVNLGIELEESLLN